MCVGVRCVSVCVRVQAREWMRDSMSGRESQRYIDSRERTILVKGLLKVPNVLPVCSHISNSSLFQHHILCACVANMFMSTTGHVSLEVCFSCCYLLACAPCTRPCGCQKGWQLWQRCRTLGNGVCTSPECITLTDASPLGHRGGGSAHSLSLPPRGRAWSAITHKHR